MSRHKPHFIREPRASRPELIADGVVHGIGLVIAIVAGAALIALTANEVGSGELAALVFYLSSLVAVLGVSCAYNLWPHTPVKWVLRRADHAMIYLLIAGTYTPILVQLDPAVSTPMLAMIWAAAALGIAVKLFLPGRFDRLAIGFYLAMGWSGVTMFQTIGETLPPTTVWLIAAGGLTYSLGVIFYAWKGLRFQSALWHAFVVVGALIHLAAMTDMMVLARS